MKQMTSDEDYRKILKKRNGWMLGILTVGILSLCILFFATSVWNMNLSSSQSSLYTGFGISFITVSIVRLLRNKALLQDEAKLHQVRIASSDERNLQISSLATRWALMALLLVMYLVMLIGGLWYPLLFIVLAYLICLFLIVYLVAWYVISRKM